MRRRLIGGDIVNDFRVISTGSLTALTATNTKIDIDVNGLKEFYLFCESVRSDNSEDQFGSTGDSYLSVGINGKDTNASVRFGSHSWGYSFLYHCVYAAGYWIIESSDKAYNNASHTVKTPAYIRTQPVAEDICNKISFILYGTASVQAGVYKIFGR